MRLDSASPLLTHERERDGWIGDAVQPAIPARFGQMAAEIEASA